MKSQFKVSKFIGCTTQGIILPRFQAYFLRRRFWGFPSTAKSKDKSQMSVWIERVSESELPTHFTLVHSCAMTFKKIFKMKDKLIVYYRLYETQYTNNIRGLTTELKDMELD